MIIKTPGGLIMRTYLRLKANRNSLISILMSLGMVVSLITLPVFTEEVAASDDDTATSVVLIKDSSSDSVDELYTAVTKAVDGTIIRLTEDVHFKRRITPKQRHNRYRQGHQNRR